MKKMNLNIAVKSILTGSVLAVASTSSFAGVVSINSWNGANMLMGATTTITASDTTASNSFTDNPALTNAAWGHQGTWYNFMNHHTRDVKINITAADTSALSPAFTLYASGSSAWGGGIGDTDPNPVSGQDTPHSFNVTQDMGAAGTLWMNGDQAGDGNMKQTLGYANSGMAHTGADAAGFGNDVVAGSLAVNLAGYATGMTAGPIGSGQVELTFQNLSDGWYTIFIGGADSSQAGSASTLTVSAVPLPAAVYLFGAGFIGLMRFRKNTA